MGNFAAASGRLLCNNAPNMYRIGWASPLSTAAGLANLTAGNFTLASNHLTFTIPAAATADANMVVINLAAAAYGAGAPRVPYPKYFLSYRVQNTTRGAYDSGLPSSYSQRLLVHNYNGSQTEREYDRSWLIDWGPRFRQRDPAFPAGDVWTAPFVPYNDATGLGGGLRVRVLRVGAASVDVDVCRMYGTSEGTPGSEECSNENDRDCDGLYGTDDPDCQEGGASQPLPPPPRPSPPLPRPTAAAAKPAAAKP
ncbi:Autolysin, partial [Tetrabaena socialis]